MIDRPDPAEAATAEPDEYAGEQHVSRRRLGVLLAVAAGALIVDIATKTLAVAQLSDAEPIRLLDGGLFLTLARNTGAAFSMGSNMTIVFTFVMIVVITVIALVARRVRSLPWAIALGLIMGGASGNLVDRLFRSPAPLKGGVVDFLSVFDPWGQVWPIFNLADVFIVSGGILAVTLTISGREIDGTRPRRDAKARKESS
ncbi:signal peptidase II [Epidermidibacterium keratini]|uniref:signal peptidase II n=1 Tax=Epidermidibacterium keratini TaxID=1891644 RepID=UPI001CEF8AA4|nr:signal peptidase II [Epidermidibacterium keratini]